MNKENQYRISMEQKFTRYQIHYRTPCQEGELESGGIDPRILDLGTRGR